MRRRRRYLLPQSHQRLVRLRTMHGTMVAMTTVTASQQTELTIDVVANGVPGRIIFLHIRQVDLVASRALHLLKVDQPQLKGAFPCHSAVRNWVVHNLAKKGS